ncbi:MAG: primosomal protein N' [Dehalococcoidia bacterium]|nr:MAG: primosomal protein N' [Dehalococcoidia bacterium]
MAADRVAAFVAVAVEAPPVFLQLFSYRVPPDLTVGPGDAVAAPFGSRLVRGIVFATEDQPAVPETREVWGRLGATPVLTSPQLTLARWLAHYYRCPPFLSASLWFPDDFPTTLDPRLSVRGAPPPDLSTEEQALLAQIAATPGIRLSALSRQCLGKAIFPLVDQLRARGCLQIELVPPRALAPARPRRSVRLLSSTGARTPTEQAIVAALGAGPQPLRQLAKVAPAARRAVHRLAERGVVELGDDLAASAPLRPPAPPPRLTPFQEHAWQQLQPRLGSGHTALIFGVTGAGKTELYLRALAFLRERGKRGIVLVPEIALTPQTAARFEERFPGRVAVFHSRLSAAERRQSWQRIVAGAVDVVVGSRSALFAPLPELGLVVLDEEHDGSYQQTDPPRYHARTVARQLAEQLGVTVLLGSATPDVTTYYAARSGEIALITLPERVTGERLPEVTVVDLRAELKAGNRSIFSRLLREKLAAVLARGEQAILYLNHRGAASVVLCRECGEAVRCRSCDTTLSYHASSERLICHLCNARRRLPERCPACASSRIRYLGLGTERVVAEVEQHFPGTRVLRLDSDIGGPAASAQVLAAFAAGEAEVLVGTQLVAKGLDLPRVTLVGVVNADIGLFLPDFRAPERVFQQLTQAVGRPGRMGGGEAIIQTYAPNHYVIQAAARHDYLAFAEQELAHRRQQRYPPFSQLVRLLGSGFKAERVQAEAQTLRARLEEERRARGAALDVLGPAPAYFRRVRGRFRWQLLLRGEEVGEFLAGLSLPPHWQVEVDPLSLL